MGLEEDLGLSVSEEAVAAGFDSIDGLDRGNFAAECPGGALVVGIAHTPRAAAARELR